jgi:hypothetical protein
MPNPSAFGDEMANENINRHSALGADQMPAYVIKTGIEQFALRLINLINFIWNKKELSEKWMKSIIVPIFYILEG